jgi:hypothetical protein
LRVAILSCEVTNPRLPLVYDPLGNLSGNASYYNGTFNQSAYRQSLIDQLAVSNKYLYTPIPTTSPSMTPTYAPTKKPSHLPTGQPSREPTRQPSSRPSRHPSRQPSSRPSRQPSSRPSRDPTSHPSKRPSRIPSG